MSSSSAPNAPGFAAVRTALTDLQHGGCLYCGAALRATNTRVEHFIAWARYPVDLGHNFVLNGKRRDRLPACDHLAGRSRVALHRLRVGRIDGVPGVVEKGAAESPHKRLSTRRTQIWARRASSPYSADHDAGRQQNENVKHPQSSRDTLMRDATCPVDRSATVSASRQAERGEAIDDGNRTKSAHLGPAGFGIGTRRQDCVTQR